MESLVNYFASANIDFVNYLETVGILIGVSFVLAFIGRFVFGKKSTFLHAVSAAIGILFIYALTIVFCGAGKDFQKFIAPLPFVTIEGDYMTLFDFKADYTIVTTHVLSMIILSFLMNLVDTWLPRGKNILLWILFRCIAVAAGLVLHLIVTGLLTKYLPEGLVTYAPVILLAILALMLLTGALKFLVGAVLTTVNPLIAALYTFFFANIIGKQITKAIITTGILAGLVLLMQEIGVTAIYIATLALPVFLPIILVLLLIWFVIGKLL